MVLIDHTSGDNFGDRAMLAGICRGIAKEGVESCIAPRGSMDTFFRDFNYTHGLSEDYRPYLHGDLSKIPNRLKSLTRHLKLRWYWESGYTPKRFRNYVDRFDSIWFVGGGYLNDSFPNNLLEKALLVREFVRQGKSAVITGNQLGPCHRKLSWVALKYIVNHAKFLGVRDPVSFERARSLGGDPFLMGDDACGAYDWNALELNGQGNSLAFNLRRSHYESPGDADVEVLLKSIDHLLDGGAVENVSCIAIASGKGESDIESALQLRGQSINPMKWHVTQSERRLSFDEIVSLYAQSKVAIGNSYHFLTFSGLCGVPFIPLYSSAYYKHKSSGLGLLWNQGDALRIGDVIDDSRFRDALKSRDALIEARVRMLSCWRDGFYKAMECVR